MNLEEFHGDLKVDDGGAIADSDVWQRWIKSQAAFDCTEVRNLEEGERNMEKIPAACAMEWSIELEKGLRSKTPGASTEAILKIGSRLGWWNRESKITIAEYKIFGLIPGEDKLFANAILLRLTDAFRLGDKQTKTCIVKIFFEELKSRRRSNYRREDDGILSKSKLDNYLELLRRVKIVFDYGDIEERALALALFGCWADIAKDIADIRYAILSSLVSEHILEVKASLFAAGCFSELADDFAFILLEIVVNMVSSCEVSTTFKLAAGRAFAKMSCSLSTADRAYKTGLKLVQDSSDEIFSIVMLISLTKVASKWTLLIPEQIELLFSFLTENRALLIQATTLKCLHFLLARGIFPFPATTGRIQSLFNILSDCKIPPALLCEAVKVLHKILLYILPSFSSSQMLEVFSMLLAYIGNTIQSSIMSTRLLGICVLVDISEKYFQRAKIEFHEVDSNMVSQVISFITDHILMLVKSMVDRHQIHAETVQEVTSLLNLLLNSVEKHPDLRCFVLDKLCVLMEYLLNILGRDVRIYEEDIQSYQMLKFGEEKMANPMLKLLLCATKIIINCLKNTDNAITVTRVLNLLKLLLENLHKSTPFDSYMFRIYLLLLNSDSVYKSVWQVGNQIVNSVTNSSLSWDNSFLGCKFHSFECAKKMFGARDYWSSYKAGKIAACQGSWPIAAFLFEQLNTVVQSDSCSQWLKSLTFFSRSESQIQNFGLVIPKGRLCEGGEGIAWKTTLSNLAENLNGASNSLRVAKETIGASVAGNAFSFQRWFLALRVKLLDTLLDIARLLGTISFVWEGSTIEQQELNSFVPSPISSPRFSSLVYSSKQISYRLKKIADELDLMATSDIGMCRKSVKIIAALAMSCSVLAFSTTFALSPSCASEKLLSCGLDGSHEQLYVVLIRDLLARLWCIDSESSQTLLTLLKVHQKSNGCFSLGVQSQAADISCEAEDIVKLCRYAVMGIVRLQDEPSRFCSVETISRTSVDGLELLLNIISRWMQIPFRCPNRFFQVRPYVSSELFFMNEDGENVDGKSILSGSHLPLNLCLQLKNMPADLPARLSKLYCILNCTSQITNGENKEQEPLNGLNWKIDDMLDLNEKLLQYVGGSARTKGMQFGNDAGNYWAEYKYVFFHLNERGQGFSTCLLDVSAFPAGCYGINWHSCCIDDDGCYWSILPLNAGPIFTVEKSSILS